VFEKNIFCDSVVLKIHPLPPPKGDKLVVRLNPDLMEQSTNVL
jgi:hypothetical protein